MHEVTRARWVIPSLAAVYIIWGSTYLAMRYAVEGLPPFFMAGYRFLAVGGVMLLGLKLKGAPWPTRRQWWAAAPVAFLMFVMGNGTVALAERKVPSGIAAVICGTMPLWAAAMGRFFGEKATVREWGGLALGVVGMALLGLGQELKADPVASALVFVAPLAWALGSWAARRLPLAPGLMSAATQMLVGGAMMAVLSQVTGEPWPHDVPPRALWAWAYLAVFGSLVAYSAYMYLLANTRTAVATSYSYVNPAIAVLLGAVMGGEAVGWETVAAVGLIVVATVIVMTGRR